MSADKMPETRFRKPRQVHYRYRCGRRVCGAIAHGGSSLKRCPSCSKLSLIRVARIKGPAPVTLRIVS